MSAHQLDVVVGEDAGVRQPIPLPGWSRALAGGALAALSLPPWGFWPLAVVGVALLAHALAGRDAVARWWIGLAFGVGQFVIGLWWMGEFTPGAALAVALEACFVGLAGLATPPGRVFVLPAGLVATEWLRGLVPFGGLPLAGLALGQVSSPWGRFAAVAGALGLVGAAAVGAIALGSLIERRPRPALLAAGALAAVTVAGLIAPDGGQAQGTLDVVAVQGGGRRGFRAVDSNPDDVYTAHFEASARVDPGSADLVLWPEDVIDLPGEIDGSEADVELSAEAARIGATLVAGVVEDDGPDHFRNRAVIWGPNGMRVGAYEKVHAVPFGEYVPFRSLVDRVADLTPVPRDATRGKGPNVISTSAGPVGIVISYEVFFSDRARSAARLGGEVLLVPTNAASFTTSQVPTQEVAAARLRALEIGRDTVQAAPTGYSAVIDHHGRVLARSTLGAGELVVERISRRTGPTLYVTWADWPLLVLTAAALGAVWLTPRRRRTQADAASSKEVPAQLVREPLSTDSLPPLA